MKHYFLIFFLLACWQVSAQDYLQLANNCFEKGDYECAKRNYTLCQAFDGKNMGTQIQKAEECLRTLNLADDYFKEKEYEKARDHYNIVLEKNSKDSYAKKQYDECERIIQIIISPKEPQNTIPDTSSYSPMSWYQEGVKNSNAGNYSEAIRCYQNALNMNPKLYNTWNGLANVYYLQGNYDYAINCFQESNDIFNNGSAWYGIGLSFAKKNNHSKSIESLKKAAQLGHKEAQKLLTEMNRKW